MQKTSTALKIKAKNRIILNMKNISLVGKQIILDIIV